MYRWFLALRYLLTRPINLLGIIGVMLGVWALILVVSIFSGYLDVVSAHVRSADADISICFIPDGVRWPQLQQALREDPMVAGCAPRLVHSGLLHRPGQRPEPPPLPGRGALQGGNGPYVSVLGVDPAQEAGVTGFAGWLADADVPAALRVADPAHPLQPIDGLPAIVLGVERMQRAGLHRGDHLLFTSGRTQLDAGREHATVLKISGEFVVAGAFHTQHTAFDGNNVFVQLDALRQLVRPGEPDAVLEVAVVVKDQSLLDETVERLRRSLPQRLSTPSPLLPGVYSWWQRESLMLGSIAHQRGLMKVILIIIMVVAAVLMFATLLMMVGEKTGDIGILCAMGGTPFGVMQLFLCCGLVTTTIGIVLGIATGCLSAIYLDAFHRLLQSTLGIDLFPTKVYNLSRVPYSLDPWWIAQVAGMELVVGAVVSALPALFASRHNPLHSLRGL